MRYRKPEIARTSFCMSRLLRRLGREDEARERLATAEVIVELFLGRPHEAPLSEECIERYVSPWVL